MEVGERETTTTSPVRILTQDGDREEWRIIIMWTIGGVVTMGDRNVQSLVSTLIFSRFSVLTYERKSPIKT